MSNTVRNQLNKKQQIFQEIFIGTLIYAVVLGFFNDYTMMVNAKSFSTIFLAAIVLEILTYLAFMLKKYVIEILKIKTGIKPKLFMIFCIWLIMFLSKFVFIWAIDFIFGNNIDINGFFGILYIVLCVTIIHKLAYKTFAKLGEAKN